MWHTISNIWLRSPCRTIYVCSFEVKSTLSSKRTCCWTLILCMNSRNWWIREITGNMWNFVDLVFIQFTLTIVILAILINVSEAYLPAIILQTFRYGKHAYNGIPSQLVSRCEIPKSYFKHFYVFAIVWSLIVFGLSSIVYVGQWTIGSWLIRGLEALCGDNRVVSSE